MSRVKSGRVDRKPPMCHDFRNYTGARLKPARLTRINLYYSALDIRKSELQLVGSSFFFLFFFFHSFFFFSSCRDEPGFSTLDIERWRTVAKIRDIFNPPRVKQHPFLAYRRF